MSKHKGYSTLNYNRFECNGCHEITVIEPGQIFSGELNCKCEVEVPKLDDTEVSVPVQEEIDYVKTSTVIVIGRFKDGDYEVCNNNNLDDTWRVPKDTFESTYVVANALTNVDPDADNTPVDVEDDKSPSITLSLDMLDGETAESIKEAFNMDELRVLAKACKIRGSSNMGEDKLIKRLMELPKAE